MCRYNIAVDEALMEEVRPYIGENVAVQSWLEEMLRKALESYLEQLEKEPDLRTEKTAQPLRHNIKTTIFAAK